MSDSSIKWNTYLINKRIHTQRPRKYFRVVLELRMWLAFKVKNFYLK